MINRPFYICRQIHFISKNASFFVIICNYPGGLHIVEATWRCIYLLLLGQQSTVTMFAMTNNSTIKLYVRHSDDCFCDCRVNSCGDVRTAFYNARVINRCCLHTEHIISPETLHSYRFQPDAVRRSSDSERIYPVCVG